MSLPNMARFTVTFNSVYCLPVADLTEGRFTWNLTAVIPREKKLYIQKMLGSNLNKILLLNLNPPLH